MRETKNLEFKQELSRTFLKTVSAFANYGNGKIMFGVKDDGTVVGVDNPVKLCLEVENYINADVDPIPDYSLDINSNNVVILTVEEGLNKPYLYRNKAYKRNDSSSIAVDRTELTRLILSGKNLSFEQLEANSQNLTFNILEKKLQEALHITELTTDILRTLKFYTNKNSFNHVAELFADTNNFPGIDIVRFGKDIDTILDRETSSNCSILKQFDDAVSMYRKYYQYEQIIDSKRNTIIKVPEKAFREAIANALAHRNWDINAHINVSMFDNRIEIVSPGSLPSDLSEEEYIRGGISVLKNPILSDLFFKLGMMETFGTGIKRIREQYKDYDVNPIFEVTEHTIKVTLPVVNNTQSFSEDELSIVNALKIRKMSISELSKQTGFSHTKLLKLLKQLMQTGNVQKSGNGRGTKYSS